MSEFEVGQLWVVEDNCTSDSWITFIVVEKCGNYYVTWDVERSGETYFDCAVPDGTTPDDWRRLDGV